MHLCNTSSLLCMTAVTPSVADMILHRYVVARVIWTYMLSIAVTYFITLCLFPGLESEIKNVTLGEWLPIIIMAIFNISDFVGKVCSNTFVDNFIFHKQTNPVNHNERLNLSSLTFNQKAIYFNVFITEISMRSDLGGRAVRMERDTSSPVLLRASGLHPSVHHVRVPRSEAHLQPPGLALHLLPPHGHF